MTATTATAKPSGTAPTGLVLTAHGLVKRYGHVVALDRCDFEVRAGEVMAVIDSEDPEERADLIRTLLAEETRMGMLVGVAIGWALATELQTGNATEEKPE